MKRTDITDIFPEATDEQVQKLMDLNGGDINRAKKNTEDLQKQLAAAQASLESYQTGAAQAEAVKQAAAQLQAVQAELDGMKQAEAVRLVREKVAGETTVPASLLTGDTEEACKEQAKAILAFAQPGGYPNVKDGGEPTGSGKTATRDLFADWFAEA